LRDSSDRFATLVAGQEVGTSKWVKVDQDMINMFGRATRDLDPMHVDPSWAAANSPFGKPIAFGFLTASLLTNLLHSAMGTKAGGDDNGATYLNYGFDRLRLIEPVPVDSMVRGHFTVLDVRIDDQQRTFVKFDCQIEISGQERPALIAEWLTVKVPEDTGA
jgi:acyl dehydratase